MELCESTEEQIKSTKTKRYNMPESSDGVFLGIVAMLATMFPEIQVINSRQESRGFSGVQAGSIVEMSLDSHGELPIGLIQEAVISEQIPDQIAEMQTTTTTAEVWQGGGPLVTEQDVIDAVIGRHIAVGATEKPGDGHTGFATDMWQDRTAVKQWQSAKGTWIEHTGFAADEMPDKNTWERTLAATGNPETGFAA